MRLLHNTENVVQANILAATTTNPDATNTVYNIALGERTTLNELFVLIRDNVAKINPAITSIEPVYRDFRIGDMRHSQANIDKIQQYLGYVPMYNVVDGLNIATEFYLMNVYK